jgi:hypothetical protein
MASDGGRLNSSIAAHLELLTRWGTIDGRGVVIVRAENR